MSTLNIPENINLSVDIYDINNHLLLSGVTTIEADGSCHFEPYLKSEEIEYKPTFVEFKDLTGSPRVPISQWHRSGKTGIGCQYHFQI